MSQLEGRSTTAQIFTAEKHASNRQGIQSRESIYRPYVFTDGNADKSVEHRFAEDLDGAAEVCVYAKPYRRDLQFQHLSEAILLTGR